MKDIAKLFAIAPEVDAILVTSEKNRRYFTGFASTFGYLVLLKDRPSVFITDPRYFEMAEVLKNDGFDVRQIDNGISGLATVCSILREAGAKRLGFEDTEMTVSEFGSVIKVFESEKVNLVPCGEAINKMRRVKTEEETGYIVKAQSVTDKAFTEILKFVKPGVTEREVAIELQYLINKLGGHGLAFDTIVASGVNTSKPHAHPTDKKIESGDAVTIDFGASYNGYCSDMTRTFFVGEPSEKMRSIYNIVLLAQKTAIKNAYCGMTGKELDSWARELIVANGYGQYFTHSTGHSLGIDIHEEPRASKLSEDKLLANQFITVEPGIYIPGVGGVRIEDLLLIKEDEVIDLTTSDKNIIIL